MDTKPAERRCHACGAPVQPKYDRASETEIYSCEKCGAQRAQSVPKKQN